ncbi:Mu-like prophage major head subunit gpT family protein [Pararhodospirillum photometricum]|uniref:Mu-like prophage major head subunit gpT family protein n=1 Tax=Pararhodospirillum photometricum TaxID=1084 RepID=UPI00030B3209|nr:Mu-like prophage major head subunit gpT family protein [Pararhodospirillum photometricum]
MIISQASLSAITTGFRVLYQGAFDAAPSDWDKIATEVPSTTRQQTYAWLGTTTRFREWVGDRVYQNLGAHQYAIPNKSWENSIEVNRDDIEDDQLGVYRPLVTQLAQDAKTHPDELVLMVRAARSA